MLHQKLSKKKKNPSVSLRNTVFSLLGALGHTYNAKLQVTWLESQDTLEQGPAILSPNMGVFACIRQGHLKAHLWDHRALSQVPRLVHLGTPSSLWRNRG